MIYVLHLKVSSLLRRGMRLFDAAFERADVPDRQLLQSLCIICQLLGAILHHTYIADCVSPPTLHITFFCRACCIGLHKIASPWPGANVCACKKALKKRFCLLEQCLSNRRECHVLLCVNESCLKTMRRQRHSIGDSFLLEQ